MHRLAILLKSYRGDLALAERLLQSFNRHNVTGLPLYCVVPDDDLELFRHLANDNVTLLRESLFADHLVVEPVAGLRPGYINQEIVKLAFHELALAESYFCVDSDAEFIRQLSESDFIAPDGFPYSVLAEDNDLKSDPVYYRQHWRDRETSLRKIAKLIGYTDPVLRTCHGHQVMSSAVLRSFVSDFLQPRGWDYRDVLAESPYEFTWYNTWLLKSGVIPVYQREPLVKVFHHEGQHQEALLRGLTYEDLARSYLAVVVNANFARELDLAPHDATKPQALAPYLSYGEVGQLLKAKARDTYRRRFRRG
jgi:hypothetical protein